MIKLEKSTEEIEYVEIFEIDGKSHSIKKKQPVNVGLRYLKMVRTDGPEVAQSWLLEQVLGEEAYDALMNFDGLTQEQLQSVMKAVGKTIAPPESPKR